MHDSTTAAPDHVAADQATPEQVEPDTSTATQHQTEVGGQPVASGRLPGIGRRSAVAAGLSAVLAACKPASGSGSKPASTAPRPKPPSKPPATTTPKPPPKPKPKPPTTKPPTTAPPTTAPPTTAPPTTTPPAPPTTMLPATSEEVAAARHLANRATFGATAADVNRILEIGHSAWIGEQLDPAGLPDAEGLLAAGYPTLTNTDFENEQVLKSNGEDLFAQLDHATLLRAVYSPRQLYEVMCDFWTNHLNVWRRSSWATHLKTRDNEQVIRPHALGRYADMLMASAKSAAMLMYLDNHSSNGSPGNEVNQNYGRELLELHTLGIIDGQHVYDEDDVLAVSKVLSGWAFNWVNGPARYTFQFNQWAHSHDAVSILGGAWSRPSRANFHDRVANAQADGESLLDFLAHHPSTARYVAWKLVRRFVSDTPPPGLVDELAAVYLANDTQIVPVLSALFHSPEFAASAGAKVKRPLDWMYSALRVSAASVATPPRGNAANALRMSAAVLGQPLFERPSPDGWPDTGPSWMSAEGLLTRWRAAAGLMLNTLAAPNKSDPIHVSAATLVPPSQPTVGAVVQWLAELRCQISVTNDDVTAICAGLQLAPDAPAAQLAGDEIRLRNAAAVLLAHPNFQRR